VFDSVRKLFVRADKLRARRCEEVMRASVRKLFIRARASVRKFVIIADRALL